MTTGEESGQSCGLVRKSGGVFFKVDRAVPARSAATRSGSTLVEVMIGCVILAILALTAAAYSYHTARVLAVQRNRTVALAAVNSRIEEIRATRYSSLTNLVPLSGSTNIMAVGGAWVWGDNETITNGSGSTRIVMPIRTTLRSQELDGDANTYYDALMVGVAVQYRAPGDWVSNNTIYAP